DGPITNCSKVYLGFRRSAPAAAGAGGGAVPLPASGRPLIVTVTERPTTAAETAAIAGPSRDAAQADTSRGPSIASVSPSRPTQRSGASHRPNVRSPTRLQSACWIWIQTSSSSDTACSVLRGGLETAGEGETGR